MKLSEALKELRHDYSRVDTSSFTECVHAAEALEQRLDALEARVDTWIMKTKMIEAFVTPMYPQANEPPKSTRRR